MTPNEYFDNIYCLHLERRADRGTEIRGEFKKHKINADIMPAVDGDDLLYVPKINPNSIDKRPISGGDMGCIMSHRGICKTAKGMKQKDYLVFEDDAEFHPNFNNLFSQFIKQVPEDWDMIYLGGSHKPYGNESQGLLPLSENVGRVTLTYTSHAVAFKNTIYDDLIEIWDGTERIDICLTILQNKYNCYAFIPNIVAQRDGYSDIMGKEVKYPHLR